MGFFQTPIRSLFRRDKGQDVEQGMSLGRAASASRPSLQVGEFLSLIVIVGCLGLTAYCMVGGRNGTLTDREFEVFKQYVWFAVSVAVGLAVNGGMGRFASYSIGSYQFGGGNMTPQPGVGTNTPGAVMDPWMGMQSDPAIKLPQGPIESTGSSMESAMSGAMSGPIDLSGGQDDSGSPIDVHGPRPGWDQ